jgi:hypothetical protein
VRRIKNDEKWVFSPAYRKCQKFFPNYPENSLFRKSRFSRPFRQKLLSYAEITLMLFRTSPVAPGCNKASENEKTSGNSYICYVVAAPAQEADLVCHGAKDEEFFLG